MNQTVTVIGASSGIGRAIAELCLAKGYTVHGISRRSAVLEAIPGLIAHPLDARDPQKLGSELQEIGSIDHLVLTMNAGSATGPMADLELDRIRNAFDNKVFPYISAILSAVPLIRQTGTITLVTGAAGRSAQQGMGVLAATNGALNHLTEVLALELAPIRVNAVSPGVVATDYWAGVPEENRGAFFDSVAAKTPVARVGKAEEIAASILFAMTNQFVTGTIIDCDGGARLK